MTEALELRGHETRARGRHRLGLPGRDPLAARRARGLDRARAAARRERAPLARSRSASTTCVVYWGDGTRGRPADAPFDAIVVTAGGPSVPQPLLAQLALGGRLVGPFGARDEQRLLRVRRDGPHAGSSAR